MGILDVKIVQDYIRMCTDGWEQGWHERNGGNLTYRMRPEEVEQCRPYFRTAGEWVSMGVTGKNLAGEYFLTTGSGKYFRNVALDPAHNIGIVEIDSAGGAWRIVWGLEDGAKPTSEFPSHFMNHSVRAAATEGVYRVIYHAHTPNLIAMTYVLPLTARDFTRALWQSATECLEDGAKPTSEFPSHFMNHSVRAAATEGVYRVIYHAHTPNLIAMTYVLPLTARDFTRALWQSATECPVVFPGGVGVVPWMVPGGADIAIATSELMKQYDAAVWAHHGLFCSGPDFDTTFGLMHTIEKAAQIWVLAQSAGQGKICQTISDDNLRAIAGEFGVTLNEAFLD